MAPVAAPKIHRNRDHAAPGQSEFRPCGCPPRSRECQYQGVNHPVRARGHHALVGATALVVADVVLAWRSDAAAPQARAWLTTLDVAVGLAFIVAAVDLRLCLETAGGGGRGIRTPEDGLVPP